MAVDGPDSRQTLNATGRATSKSNTRHPQGILRIFQASDVVLVDIDRCQTPPRPDLVLRHLNAWITPLLALLLLTGCAEEAHRIAMTLSDGSHVSGLFLSVEDDWLVIDRNISAPEADLLLVDKAIIDTLVLTGRVETSDRLSTMALGAGGGALVGYWAGEGYLPDSTHPANPRRAGAATVGALSGLVVGAGISYLLTDAFGARDITIVMPDQDQFDSISSFAKYPYGLPTYLRDAIDSGYEIHTLTDSAFTK